MFGRANELLYETAGAAAKKGDCLYYLNHFDSPNDFYEMKEEEMEELVGVVSNAGFFDHIVMDLGCSMGQKNIKAFELANRIVLLERNNQMTVSKQKVLCVKNFDMGKKMHRMMSLSHWLPVSKGWLRQ